MKKKPSLFICFGIILIIVTLPILNFGCTVPNTPARHEGFVFANPAFLAREDSKALSKDLKIMVCLCGEMW